MVVDACSEDVFVVVAAADDTSHAEARRAKPSQASQSREGPTSGFGHFYDDGSVTRHRAGLITKPPILDESNDLMRLRQEGEDNDLSLDRTNLAICRMAAEDHGT